MKPIVQTLETVILFLLLAFFAYAAQQGLPSITSVLQDRLTNAVNVK